MHETTQRRVCRVVFLSLCVLPTLLLAVWVGGRLWPGQHDAMLASVGGRLGCRVDVRGFSTPTPDVWRLIGVSLTDPEKDTPVASADWLECRFENGALQVRGGELQIAAPGAPVAECMDRLLCDDWPVGKLRARFERMTLADGGSWNNLDIELSASSPKGRRFTLAERDGVGQLIIERDRQASPPETRLLGATGDQSIAGAWLGIAKSDATYSGQVNAVRSDGHTDIHLAGQLAGLEPSLLLGDGGGVSLATPLRVKVERLHLREGRIVTLQADIEAKRGTVEHRVLLAAARGLGCQPTAELQRIWPSPADTGPYEPIPFERIAFSVRLDEDGLVLTGREDGVLASTRGPLMLAPANDRAPVDALLHFVAPQAERYHPATRQSVDLANRLPLGATLR